MLKTAPIFGNNMILQRNKTNFIRGTAPDNEVVEVRFLRRSYIVEVRNGKWEVELEPMDAGGPYTMDIYCKMEHLHFQNIMIGEVWLLCGKPDVTGQLDGDSQEQPVFMGKGAIYTYHIRQKDSSKEWELYLKKYTEKENIFAYHLGKKLYEELRVPVGIITCYSADFGMMHKVSEKIAPYGLKGVLFYQNLEDLCETLVHERIEYAMLSRWRELFMNKTLDIYLMQIPTHISNNGDNWCMLKQKPSMESDKEGVTVIMDCNEYDSKEHTDKSHPACRVAVHVLEKTYGRKIRKTASYMGRVQLKDEEMEYYFAV